MRIEITAEPVFWIQFSVEQLQTIMKFSANHYDFVCREVSKSGGFVYGWYNAALFHSQDMESVGDYSCKATRRQLDTVCKILELGDTLPDFECVRTVSSELRRAIRNAEARLIPSIIIDTPLY